MPTFLYGISLCYFAMPLYFFEIFIDTLIEYVFIDAHGKEEVGRGDRMQKIHIQVFRLMFQTDSSLVRKKEHYICSP